jgi:hypothetical protein
MKDVGKSSVPPCANGSALVATIQIRTSDVRCRESKSAMGERQVAFACEAKTDCQATVRCSPTILALRFTRRAHGALALRTVLSSHGAQ